MISFGGFLEECLPCSASDHPFSCLINPFSMKCVWKRLPSKWFVPSPHRVAVTQIVTTATCANEIPSITKLCQGLGEKLAENVVLFPPWTEFKKLLQTKDLFDVLESKSGLIFKLILFRKCESNLVERFSKSGFGQNESDESVRWPSSGGRGGRRRIWSSGRLRIPELVAASQGLQSGTSRRGGEGCFNTEQLLVHIPVLRSTKSTSTWYRDNLVERIDRHSGSSQKAAHPQCQYLLQDFIFCSPARTSGIWPNKGAAERDGGGDLLEDIGTFSSITSSLLHLTSPYYSHIFIQWFFLKWYF